MPTRCKNVELMLRRGLLPIRHGQWIDAYNLTTAHAVAGTVTARIGHGNMWFTMQITDETEDFVRHGERQPPPRLPHAVARAPQRQRPVQPGDNRPPRQGGVNLLWYATDESEADTGLHPQR